MYVSATNSRDLSDEQFYSASNLIDTPVILKRVDKMHFGKRPQIQQDLEQTEFLMERTAADYDEHAKRTNSMHFGKRAHLIWAYDSPKLTFKKGSESSVHFGR